MSLNKPNIKPLPDWAETVYQTIRDSRDSEARDTEFKTKEKFSPASLTYSGACSRRWVLAFNGADWEDTFEPAARDRIEAGNDSEIRMLERIKDIVVAQQVPISIKDPPIHGFMDALLRVDDLKIPAELKNTMEQSYVHRYLGKPIPGHLVQVLIYMHATNKSVGALVYQNRNDLDVTIIPIYKNEYTDALLNHVFEWMREVYKAYEEGEMPKRNFRKGSKICQGCPVQKTCDADEAFTVEIPKLEIKL